MARPTIRERLRSFFSYASSTIWPNSAHRIVRILIACTIIFAIIHLSLCAAMAQVQLNIRKEVECWDIDNPVDLRHHSLSNKVFTTTMKKLPVTFVNVGVLAGWKEASGPKYVYLGSPEWYGKVPIVISLFVFPLWLILLLCYHLSAHFRSRPVSHCIAMLYATYLWIQFLFDNVSMFIYNNFPSEESQVYDEACWRSDGTMRALAHVGHWAKRMRIAGTVVGWLGIGCMWGYFFVTFRVALGNQTAADQEPVPLADLSGLAANRPAGQGGNVNSARLAGTGVNLNAQPTANAGPRTGQDAVALPRPAATRPEQHERPQERSRESELDRLEREFERLGRQLERPQNRQERELERLERELSRLENQLDDQVARQRERQERRTEESLNPFTDPRNVVT